MNLFLYYAFCSVKNQIRKLFKTWVAIFLVICIAIGVVIGVIAASVESLVEDSLPDGNEGIEQSPDELPSDDPLEEEITIDMTDGEVRQLVEAIISGVLLVMVVFEVMGAEKNGSNIFMMADVNLLFSSPMRPQSVLMFRLCCQMGAMIFLGIYLLLEVPMMVTSFGFTPLAAAVVVISFALAVLFGKLLNVLLYTLCSSHDRLKKWLRPALYTVLALIAFRPQPGSRWRAGRSSPSPRPLRR